MTARFFGEALDQRSVQKSADDRNDEHKPDSEERQVQARRVSLLTESSIDRFRNAEDEDTFAKSAFLSSVSGLHNFSALLPVDGVGSTRN